MAALSRIHFYDTRNPCLRFLQRGTLAWLLAHFTWQLFPEDLFAGWRGQSGRGRMAWPARILFALALLRWQREGMSRRTALQEAYENVTWRAAMGLRLTDPIPSERTLRDYEHALSRRQPGRPQRTIQHIFEHLAHCGLALGIGLGHSSGLGRRQHADEAIRGGSRHPGPAGRGAPPHRPPIWRSHRHFSCRCRKDAGAAPSFAHRPQHQRGLPHRLEGRRCPGRRAQSTRSDGPRMCPARTAPAPTPRTVDSAGTPAGRAASESGSAAGLRHRQ